MKQADMELLKQIARFEDSADMDKEYRIGWSWRHVRIWPATLSRLFQAGYLEMVFRSNSHTGYRLSQLGRTMARESVDEGIVVRPADTENLDQLRLTEGLFGDIIGHDLVKELLGACLASDKPVHVLLAGPPALAKSLFLWDIERAAAEKALWLVGSAVSKAGLWDIIAERQPWALLIDELDKMNAADTGALLSMMEGGRLVRAKKGRQLDLSHPLRVVAACNRLDRLSPELRSRFAVCRLRAYGREEYRAVVQGVLIKAEKLEPEMAAEIARRLDGLSQDVRDAVRVARLAPRLGVARAVGLLLGGAAEGDVK